jgi:hypothetical protein
LNHAVDVSLGYNTDGLLKTGWEEFDKSLRERLLGSKFLFCGEERNVHRTRGTKRRTYINVIKKLPDPEFLNPTDAANYYKEVDPPAEAYFF